MEDIVDRSCEKMKDIIHKDWSRSKSFKSIQPRLDAEIQTLVTRKLKRETEDLADKGKRKIRREIADFFSDAENLLMKIFQTLIQKTL